MKIRIEQSQKVEEKSALNLTSIDGLAGRLFNQIRGKSPTISHTHFFVDLQVELTNEEKAIIHQYNLGDIVIEEYIDHTLPNQLIEEFNATPPFDQKKTCKP